jgi:hypothetical protein
MARYGNAPQGTPSHGMETTGRRSLPRRSAARAEAVFSRGNNKCFRQQGDAAEQGESDRHDRHNRRRVDLSMQEQGDGALVVGLVRVMVQPFVQRRAGREGGEEKDKRAQQDGPRLPDHRCRIVFSAHALFRSGLNHPRRTLTSIIIGIYANYLYVPLIRQAGHPVRVQGVYSHQIAVLAHLTHVQSAINGDDCVHHRFHAPVLHAHCDPLVDAGRCSVTAK